MKKRYILFLMIAIACVAFASSNPVTSKSIRAQQAVTEPEPAEPQKIQETEKAEETIQPSFVLPASLQVIDDEAFEGTALQSVALPESVSEIGDRAFADNPELSVIRMPSGLERIGEDILAGSSRAVMIVHAGSEAMNQAREEGYRFFVITAIGEKRTESYVPMMAGSVSHTEGYEQESGVCSAETRAKRTGRTEAELKGELYRGVAALYIRSRYFP